MESKRPSLLLCATFLAVFLQVSSDSHQSPCQPDLRAAQCLAAVKQLLADENRYWFGSSYNAACGFPPASFTSACNNNDKTHLSIVTRLRESSDNSTDTIRQVLNVTYDVPAGSYQACGNTYQVPAVTRTLDPTQTSDLTLWSADHDPAVSWQGEVNKIYTLIVWDAGAVLLHGVMYNIRGSNLDSAETGYNYRGPKNPVDRDQPYVFLLYEQPALIDPTNMTNAVIAFLSNNIFLTPTKFVNAFSLSGPVGVGVLNIKTDMYATEFMKQSRIVNYCPTMLTPTFAALPLSYDVSSARLMSSIDVTFTSPDISFRSCCSDVTIASNSRMTNPFGNGVIAPVYTRHAPRISLVPNNLFDTYYYLRNRYTLLLLDVTDELSRRFNPDTRVHWQVVNIRQGDVTSGQTTLAYKAPLPLTGEGDRTLMFLLLRQSTMAVDVATLTRFTSNSCPRHLMQRCRFNLTAFMTELGMTVEGASWFVTSPDAYSRQQVVLANLQTEPAACATVSGYSNPCQSSDTCSSGADIARLSSVAFGLCGVLMLLVKMAM